jgi:hypothetical protein
VEDWPLILCGPMLREVTPDLVTVFIALKCAAQVRLKLRGALPRTPWTEASPFQPTHPLGARLHVLLVRLAPSSALERGKVYEYDLEIAPDDSAGCTFPRWQPLSAAYDFASLGLLDGDAPLGYAPGDYPSFALAEKLEHLRLVHGSCRLPHGDGRDMLALVDGLVRAHRAKPRERPHQLLLTGDQIYADDVDACLSAMLTATARELLGWTPHESIPFADGTRFISLAASDTPQAQATPPLGYARDQFRERHDAREGSTPASRQALNAFQTRAEFVYSQSDLTSDSADCHLLFLGEFYAMYLFAWSDALWPREGGTLTAPTPSEAIPLGSIADWGEMRWWKTSNYREQAAKSHRRLLRFAATVPAVRRALANVPTAMMFDDHEVTDDWFLNRWWHDTLLANPAGRRVVRNALLAYAVFQDWGNRPGDYPDPVPAPATAAPAGATPGERLLRALCWEHNGAPPVATDPSMVDSLLFRGSAASAPSPDRKIWHFTLEGPDYGIVMLDNRTLRGYPSDPLLGDTGPAELIARESQRAQLDPAQAGGRKLTIVVSGTPIVGAPLIEIGQGLGARAPQSRKVALDWASKDFEAWGSNESGFAGIMEQCRLHRRLVVLSGDVHYAFVNDTRIFHGEGAQFEGARLVQLCCSALKNHSESPLATESRPLRLASRTRWSGAFHPTAPGWHDALKGELSERVGDMLAAARAVGASPQQLSALSLAAWTVQFAAGTRRAVTVVDGLEVAAGEMRKVVQYFDVGVGPGRRFRARSSEPVHAVHRIDPATWVMDPAATGEGDSPFQFLGHNNVGLVTFEVNGQGVATQVTQQLFFFARQDARDMPDRIDCLVASAPLRLPLEAEWDES